MLSSIKVKYCINFKNNALIDSIIIRVLPVLTIIALPPNELIATSKGGILNDYVPQYLHPFDYDVLQ